MKRLRQLDEANEEARRKYEAPQLNGIACPRCAAELFDMDPQVTLMSYPPQKSIGCGACGWAGYRIA